MTQGNGLKSFAFVAALIVGLSWIQVDPGGPANTGAAVSGPVAGGTVDPGEVAAGPVAAGPSSGALAPTKTGPGHGGASVDGGEVGADGSGAGAEGVDIAGGGGGCAGAGGGGATDTGVTADEIRLATTAVLDGPAKSLLEDSVTGMKAVIDRVNKSGGVCGRRLKLDVKNDSFDAARGQQFIRNFTSEGYFALPVVPSAEGLGAAIGAGDISSAQIPVVGTDGMRREQYDADGQADWVWPVATATVSTMRVIADYAYKERGARSFAIVYDSKYDFGEEGTQAFIDQVEAVAGKSAMKKAQPLDPTTPSYATEAESFNQVCGNDACDAVVMLLLPETAAKWLARKPAMGKLYTAGAQTLFTDAFARDCVQVAGPACHGLAVWTGYNPPIDTYATLPDVARYVSDVTALDPSIDVKNQFVEGAYLGMTVFVEALERVGPNLTRAALQQVLDSMDFESDIASTLTWRPGDHKANTGARSFSMVVTQGTFNGWRDEGTGFRADPKSGV